MSVEHHEHPDIVDDLNGLGERVNKAEVCMAEVRTKVERSEDDVQKLFILAESNADQLSKTTASLAGLSGKIAGAVAVITTLVTIAVKLAEHFLAK